MPDKKLLALCQQISTEKDATAAIDELYALLHQEQDVIKAKVRYALSRSTAIPE